LVPMGGRIIDDLPPAITLSIDSVVKKVEETVYDWVAYFQEVSAPSNSGSNHLNILLFGLAGATKSSFINSVFTLLDHSLTDVKNPALAGGSSGHVTTNIGRYEVPGVPSIRLYDVWGLSKDNFTGNELEYLLNGKLPVNFNMKQVNDITAEILDRGSSTALTRKIHCVLFFLPQAVLADQNQAPFRRLLAKSYQYISQTAKLNPLLILTKVDEISDIRENSTGPWPALEKLKDEAARLLNIPPGRVLYNINYFQERKKNFHIDKMTFTILREAVASALVYAQNIVTTTTDSGTKVDEYLW